MSAEAALIVALLCSALLPLLGTWGRVATSRRLVFSSVVLLWLGLPVALIWASVVFWRPVADVPQPDNRPVAVRMDGYLGSGTCRTCHPHEHSTWHASFHRTMTQVATPETVLAPFDNIDLDDGLSFRAMRRGDQFSVLLPAPYEERPIVMTTGSHHMQVYWFPPHDGSRYLGMVPFTYLIDEGRWLPRRTVFLQPPESQTEFKLGVWNRSCMECHATNGKMRPAIQSDGNWRTDQVDTRVAAFGISCEACHGPGEEHARANRNPARRYAHHLGSGPDKTIVNPSRLPHDLSSQVCGQCHGIMAVEPWRPWALDGSDFRPGDDLTRGDVRFLVDFHATPMRPEVQELARQQPDFYQDYFWSDGTVRVSGREYNALLETPCYQRGELSCLSCHVMHPQNDPRGLGEWANDQLRFDMLGDQACVQCHDQYQTDAQIAAHTHHQPKSSGSRCYNCHMPFTTYGLLKGIRSHRIEVPSVATSLSTGRPNGCNQCHLDRTLQWTSENLATWYGTSQPDLTEDEQSVAASVLWLLRGDAAQRALMAWSYGWDAAKEASGTDWLPPFLLQLQEDPYHAVRLIASRSLRKIPGFEDFDYDWKLSADELAESRRRGIQVWTEMQKAPAPATVLINEPSSLRQDQISRLLQQRNDRPVYVAE